MTARFSSTGVAAGTANLRQVFSTPADRATSDMKPMYGNMIRVMATAPSNSFSPEAISHTTTGAPAMPTAQVATRAQNRTVATASTSRRVCASPSRTWVSARIGTNACEKAPSANSRRSRLGIRNATW
jgi:hypothetical protein